MIKSFITTSIITSSLLFAVPSFAAPIDFTDNTTYTTDTISKFKNSNVKLYELTFKVCKRHYIELKRMGINSFESFPNTLHVVEKLQKIIVPYLENTEKK
jgi:hypothetical protein